MTNNEVSMNIGFPSLLGLIFITLKLTGVIDWSWWWVLSPFWIVWAVVGFVVILAVIVNLFPRGR